MEKSQDPNATYKNSASSSFRSGEKKEEGFKQKAGDVVERVGEKIKDMGAEKLGNAIYKAGNKLEHSGDKSKGSR